ncbi:MAG TPA: lipopolysaccharide biosynthesis protein [Terriglobales bacterium]|nr:lipopolysaccharide biosynthesis protein [Terriglobales bacterium]
MVPFDASGEFHPLAEGRQLRRLAVRGAAAALSAQALSLALRVVPTVVLARLLTPADFGLVTMVTTFSLLLMSFGSNGFNEAVIQRHEINRFQASNLFWINCAVGLTLTIGFAAAGSLLARFFRNPLVAHVVVAMSLVIFITATSDIHLALLKRAMRFPAVSVNDVVALAVYSAVGVLLAWRGWGYWALVAANVAQALSTTVGAWWLCRWIPSLPRRGLGTDAEVRFAAKVYGRFSFNYFTRNFDNLLVGWRFNAVALGFYKKAYDLFALSASQLTAPINNVALAALSRLNQDPARFKRYLANSLAIVAFVGMAVGADLTLVGKDVVRLVLGVKWSESGRIFQLFGPGIGIMLLYSTVGWIHLSIGKPGRWLRWTLIESAATASLFVLALSWGPAGIAVAWSMSYWILSIPAFWYAGRPIGFGISSLIGTVWRYAAASLVAGIGTAAIIRGTVFWSTPPDATAALQAIIIVSALFVTLYLGVVILLHWGCAPLRQVAGLVREIAPSRRATRPAAELV